MSELLEKQGNYTHIYSLITHVLIYPTSDVNVDEFAGTLADIPVLHK